MEISDNEKRDSRDSISSLPELEVVEETFSPAESKSLTTGIDNIAWYKDRNILRFFIMGVMVAVFAALEFAFGLITNSLALLADAFHMLSDVISLVIGFLSYTMSKRTKSKEYSYGWIRSETIGALVNGVFLLSISFYIMLEALQRFVTPPVIQNPQLILIVAGCGLFVNLLGMLIFGGSHGGGGHSHSHGHGHGHSHGHSHKKGSEEPNQSPPPSPRHENDETVERKSKNLNIKAVFLHAIGDALGSLGAMVSGLGIWLLPFKEKYYLDPICSIIIAIILLVGTLPLVKNCVKILMQTVPPDINLEKIESEMLKIKGVLSIHEFHVWQLSMTKIIGTVHISCSLSVEFFKVAVDIKQVLHKYGVHATTIQPEFVDTDEAKPMDCNITCQSTRCQEKLCCAEDKLTKRKPAKV